MLYRFLSHIWKLKGNTLPLEKYKDMSKFTDDFFAFPIKVYDGFSLKKAMDEEDKVGTEAPVPIDWVAGWVRIPVKDLPKMMWHEGFSRERSVKDVAEEGFDLTIVITDSYGEFVSTWPRKKFEAKLDDFMAKYQTRAKDYLSSPNPHILVQSISPEGQ